MVFRGGWLSGAGGFLGRVVFRGGWFSGASGFQGRVVFRAEWFSGASCCQWRVVIRGEYHLAENNFSFDALQAYCFRIKKKTVMTVIFPGGVFFI